MTTLQVHMNTTIIKQWSVVVGFVFCLGHCEEFESHRQNGHKWPVPDTLQNTWKAFASLQRNLDNFHLLFHPGSDDQIWEGGSGTHCMQCAARPPCRQQHCCIWVVVCLKKPASVLPEWNMDRWEAQNLVLFQSSPFFHSLSLSLTSLSLLSLKRERLVQRD